MMKIHLELESIGISILGTRMNTDYQDNFWKKILLNFLGQIKRLLHSFPFNQAFGHFIDCITQDAYLVV